MTRFVVWFTVMLIAGTAAAQITYQPLDSGLEWTYEGPGENQVTVEVEGITYVHGAETRTLRWEETSPAQVYHNCWTVGEGGYVLLHGAWNEDGFVASYRPAVKYLPPYPWSSRCWSSTSDVFWSLDASVPSGDVLDVTYCVLTEDVLTVPAGTFDAIEVGLEEEPPPLVTARDGAVYAPSGRRIPVGETRVVDGRWYAADVGQVKEGEQVLTYFSGITPNEVATWGAVKNLYK